MAGERPRPGNEGQASLRWNAALCVLLLLISLQKHASALSTVTVMLGHGWYYVSMYVTVGLLH